LSSYILTHKQKEVSVDGNWKLFNNDNMYVSLYTWFKLEQDENSRKLPSKVHVRAHHDDNKVVSIGFEDYDVLGKDSKFPETISVWGLAGGELQKGWKSYAGAYTSFNWAVNRMQLHKYMAGVKQGRDFYTFVEAGINRKEVIVKDETTQTETKTYPWIKTAAWKVFGKPCEDVRVWGDLTANFDDGAYSGRIAGEYKIEKNTFVKAKIATDRSLTLGITHNFNNFLNFGFVAQLTCAQPKTGTTTEKTGSEKSPECPISKCCVPCFKTKFGVIFEVNDA